MEDMMTSTQGGWITAAVIGIATLAKMALDAHKERRKLLDSAKIAREKESAEDTKEDKKTAQDILKAQVQSLTSKVEALERQVSLLIEERQTLSTSQAALRVQLDAALAEVARLRKSRDRYREIALRARDEAARGTLEESSLGEELSVADEASSLS